MESVLLVIHLIVAMGIIVLVLIQPSEAGGFLGSSGSMSNLMMPRRSADVLSRTTTILAICFFATSLGLAIMAQNRPEQKSILDVAAEAQATATAPVDTGKVDTGKADTGKDADALKKEAAPADAAKVEDVKSDAAQKKDAALKSAKPAEKPAEKPKAPIVK
jgi:preprotein translocase subunit SecG